MPHHGDFFVRLSRRDTVDREKGSERTILFKGFVTGMLHDHGFDQPEGRTTTTTMMINLSLDDILSLNDEKSQSSATALQPLLQRLNEAVVTMTTTALDEHDPFVEQLQKDLTIFSRYFFAKCQLSLALVDRLGACRLVLITNLGLEGEEEEEEFQWRPTNMTNISLRVFQQERFNSEKEHKMVYECSAFHPSPVWLREANSISRSKLRTYLRITTVVSANEKIHQHVSLHIG